MELVSLFVILLLVAGALAAVLYPLLRGARPSLPADARQGLYSGNTAGELRARYAAALAALKDLEFDREMGKISQEDYQSTRLRLTRDAAALLKQLDELTAPAVITRALDAEIEDLLANFRAGRREISPEAMAEVEEEIEALKGEKAAAAGPAIACPQCGQAAHPADRFCAACGTPFSMHCPACGQAIVEGDAFCTHCGTALLKEEATL
ncbi:MAG: zinc ribbon domain-containing protein [Anaerolineae bacterium]